MKTEQNPFERKVEDLLSEDAKGSRLEIPASIYDRIVDFQAQYRALYGLRITREKVILLLIVEGIEGLQAKLCDIEKAVESLEK